MYKCFHLSSVLGNSQSIVDNVDFNPYYIHNYKYNHYNYYIYIYIYSIYIISFSIILSHNYCSILMFMSLV